MIQVELLAHMMGVKKVVLMDADSERMKVLLLAERWVLKTVDGKVQLTESQKVEKLEMKLVDKTDAMMVSMKEIYWVVLLVVSKAVSMVRTKVYYSEEKLADRLGDLKGAWLAARLVAKRAALWAAVKG